MKLKTFENTDALYQYATEIIVSEIKKKPNLTLGLAAGRTPTRLYELLVKEAKNRGLSFKNIKTVNLDEYVGVDPDAPQSFYTYTRKTLTNPVGVLPENAIALNGIAKSLEEECFNYENKIKAFGGIDLQILGLGENGHIGFNEPGSEITSRTRVIDLSETTKKNQTASFPGGVPSRGITIGIANVLSAKKIVLIATGKAKAVAVKNSFFKSPTSQWPASFCLEHKDFIALIDSDAARLLTAAEEKLLDG